MSGDTIRSKKDINYALTLVPLGIAINLVIGTIVAWLKIPVYLDAVGTIIVTLVLGWRYGAITGVLSFLLGGVLFNPVLPYFCGTQIAIALYVDFIASKGGFKNIFRCILSGIGLGIVAGILSAPVITYLFGGITGTGRSFFTAYLITTGKGIWKSVVFSGLASEPIDKTIQVLLSFWLIKGIPKSMLQKFKSNLLKTNNFV